MSENPAHPDAHPTAPGGMSRPALIAELVNEWDYEPDSDWDGTTWPDLIDMVVAERLAAESVEPMSAEEYADINGEPDDEDEDDPEVEAKEERKNDEHEAEFLERSGMAEAEEDRVGLRASYEFTPDLGKHVEPMLDDPVFPSAKRMFADEGPDPMIDTESGVDIDDLLAEFDDTLDRELVEEAHAVESALSARDTEMELTKAIADEDGVLDPEMLFAEMTSARDEELSKQPPPLFLGIPGVRDYIFDGHAGAGPSGAERWMNCTMSLSASRKFLETLSPRQQAEFAKSGTAARQGTTAHAAAEATANHMLGRVDDDELDMTLLELMINPDHETEAYDDEMGDYVGEYVDLVRSYAQERGADAIEVESRVEAAIPLSGMREDEVYVVRGSADLTVLPEGKHKSLVVGDLKYGEGIDVDVESNPQIRLYALGVLGQYINEGGEIPADFATIEYIIAQPRLGGIKRWSESVDDLLTWRDEVLSPALTKALYGDAEGATYEPSELACQWCPARGGCPALAESVVERGAELFTVMSEAEFEGGPGAFPETTSLSPARLGELLTMVEDMDKLRKSLKEEAQRRLHRGEHVPGYHLVNYSPKRHWVGDIGETREDIVERLKQEGLPKKQIEALFTEPVLISPPAAEKVLGKEGFPNVMALVVKPDPVPVVGRENDRRKAWSGKPPEAMFANEED